MEVEEAKPSKTEQLLRGSELGYRRLFEAAKDGLTLILSDVAWAGNEKCINGRNA